MIVEFPLMFAFVMLTFQKGDYKTRPKPKDNKVSGTYQNIVLFDITRSYAALRAADLDRIVGPGYSLGGSFWGKTMKNQPGTTKNQSGTMKNHENQPGTMKNHENQPVTMTKP